MSIYNSGGCAHSLSASMCSANGRDGEPSEITGMCSPVSCPDLTTIRGQKTDRRTLSTRGSADDVGPQCRPPSVSMIWPLVVAVDAGPAKVSVLVDLHTAGSDQSSAVVSVVSAATGQCLAVATVVGDWVDLEVPPSKTSCLALTTVYCTSQGAHGTCGPSSSLLFAPQAMVRELEELFMHMVSSVKQSKDEMQSTTLMRNRSEPLNQRKLPNITSSFYSHPGVIQTGSSRQRESMRRVAQNSEMRRMQCVQLAGGSNDGPCHEYSPRAFEFDCMFLGTTGREMESSNFSEGNVQPWDAAGDSVSYDPDRAQTRNNAHPRMRASNGHTVSAVRALRKRSGTGEAPPLSHLGQKYMPAQGAEQTEDGRSRPPPPPPSSNLVPPSQLTNPSEIKVYLNAWHVYFQPFIEDLSYLLTCVPNACCPGGWDRTTFMDTLSRRVVFFHQNQMWHSLSELMHHAEKVGVLVWYGEESVHCAEMSGVRWRHLLEFSPHGQLVMKCPFPRGSDPDIGLLTPLFTSLPGGMSQSMSDNPGVPSPRPSPEPSQMLKAMLSNWGSQSGGFSPTAPSNLRPGDTSSRLSHARAAAAAAAAADAACMARASTRSGKSMLSKNPLTTQELEFLMAASFSQWTVDDGEGLTEYPSLSPSLISARGSAMNNTSAGCADAWALDSGNSLVEFFLAERETEPRKWWKKNFDQVVSEADMGRSDPAALCRPRTASQRAPHMQDRMSCEDEWARQLCPSYYFTDGRGSTKVMSSGDAHDNMDSLFLVKEFLMLLALSIVTAMVCVFCQSQLQK